MKAHTDEMPTVRPATLADIDGLRAMLARAFADDPLIAWALPNRVNRVEHTEAWLGWFLDAYLADGFVHCIDDLAAVLWLPPGQRAAEPPEGTPTLHDLLTDLNGHDHATRVLTGFASSGPRRPTDAHIYLHILGVAPEAQGKGLGAEVLGPMLTLSDDDVVSIHLESANPRNHAFYERLGFERTGVDHLGEGGPTLTSFCREPSGDLEIA